MVTCFHNFGFPCEHIHHQSNQQSTQLIYVILVEIGTIVENDNATPKYKVCSLMILLYLKIYHLGVFGITY